MKSIVAKSEENEDVENEEQAFGMLILLATTKMIRKVLKNFFFSLLMIL